MGVDTGGAGDQGMMFGYACNETPELMPMPIMLAHKLTRRLSDVRKEGLLDYLRPDGKSQVTVEYAGHKPVRVNTVVISTPHSESVANDQIHEDVINHVIRSVVPGEMMDAGTGFHINPTGLFEALKAHDELKAKGISIRVIDLYSVQPIDAASLIEAGKATNGRLITVEDHYISGGLGDAVARAGLTVRRMAIPEIPRSGKPDELLDKFGISSRHIVNAVMG
jgi:deoxyxylulose-5-phosphate synthase